MANTPVKNDRNSNPDPITGAPGSHPIGTGVGAATGGVAAGAIGGAVAGPIGAVVGAAAGAVVGGLAGKGVAEMIDPTAEEAYWRDRFADRPYVEAGSTFEEYWPAYAYGLSARARYPDREFTDIEAELARDWDRARGSSTLDWEPAKHAVRDAWSHIEEERFSAAQ
jgi:hypothetical protein